MFIILAIIAYLLGSICSAILVCKFMGLPDPRTSGSGNPGATNVLRLAGKKAAIVVLMADGIKGFIPVILARMVGISGIALGFIAVIALLGHIYPVFFRFKGGKGFATALGVIFGLNIFVGILALITWAVIVYFSRYSSLGAIITALLLPIYILIFSDTSYFLPVLIITIIVIWRHKDNIQRLRAGTETRMKFGNTP